MRLWLRLPNCSPARSEGLLSSSPCPLLQRRRGGGILRHALRDFRFPPTAIRAIPKLAGLLVRNYFARLRFEVDCVTSAPGDVSQVTKQRALLAIFNLRIQFCSFANAGDEVREVQHIVGLAFDFTDHPAVQVIDFAIVAGQRERTFSP